MEMKNWGKWGRSGWILTRNELGLTFRVPNCGASFHQIVENFGHGRGHKQTRQRQ